MSKVPAAYDWGIICFYLDSSNNNKNQKVDMVPTIIVIEPDMRITVSNIIAPMDSSLIIIQRFSVISIERFSIISIERFPDNLPYLALQTVGDHNYDLVVWVARTCFISSRH